MMRRRGFATGAVALLLAGCSASPSPTSYTLLAMPGPQRTPAVRTVVLRPVSIARYLDKPAIVLSAASYEVSSASNDWWAEPLGSMLGRILVEELSQRLQGASVISDSGAIVPSTQAAVVEVNILRLDGETDGTVVLRGQFGVTRPGAGAGAVTRAVVTHATPPQSGTRGTVAAMSEAVGKLADEIASALATR